MAATAVDFGTLTLLVEVLHLFYVTAVAIGAFLGAVTNFTINHGWAFSEVKNANAGSRIPKNELKRYALVSLGSLVLNALLVFCFTELFRVSYLISKITVAVLVGWFYNYPLHRRFVWSPK